MEIRLTRVVSGYFWLIQENDNRVIVWDSDDVYECPVMAEGRRPSLANKRLLSGKLTHKKN